MARQRKLFLVIFATLFVIVGCADLRRDSGNMYEDLTYWFDNGKEIDSAKVDVFYILPTCVFDWTDAEGNVHHYASLTDEKQRAAMKPSYELADEIFGDSANFFAPYYRHISLDTWMEGADTVDARFPYAMNDIREAFRYYMDNWNQGRPFVLAGFSQGGKCVVELLKTLDEEMADRLVAAYVCGYKVTEDDLAMTKNIKAARCADDTGVTVVYNSVTSTSAVSPVLANNNHLVINPASWTTDTMPHELNDSMTVTISPKENVLVVSGADADLMFVESLATMFPKGNLHLQELTLYKDQLRDNVKTRIRAFNK